MITWDDSLTTGIPEIDAQHKEIIIKFNELYKAISHGKGMDIDAAGEVLDFLQFYAAWHFEREEKCMEQYRCPAAEANKEAHAEFLKKFNLFYEQWHESGMNLELVYETYFELEKWIANHIQHTDTKLYQCVNKRHRTANY